MKAVAAALVAVQGLVLVGASPVERGARYLEAQQRADGGFAERGRATSPEMTAWAVLGLAATGKRPQGAAAYLAGKPYPAATDLALRILALRTLGEPAGALADRLEALRRPDGRIGSLVNSTIWGVLALRSVGRPAGTATRYLVRNQRPSGGWAWYPGGRPDSNDTAAAVEALRAAGVGGRPVRRALAFLRRTQNRDGGFGQFASSPSDAQSTAWAIQAFVAARREPGPPAFRYLLRLQRRDGSFRYSRRYGVTPVWVTSQVLPALARKPFPLTP